MAPPPPGGLAPPDRGRLARALGLAPEELEALEATSAQSGQRLARRLARAHGLEALRRCALEAFGIDAEQIGRLDPPVQRRLPPAWAAQGEAVELGVDAEGTLLVGVSSPLEYTRRASLERLLGSLHYRIHWLTAHDIARLAPAASAGPAPAGEASSSRAQRGPGRDAGGAFQDIIDSDLVTVDAAVPEAAQAELVAGTQTGERLIQVLFERAVALRATDVHVEPYASSSSGEQGVRVRMRVDKVLRVMPDLCRSGDAGRRAADTIARSLKISATVDMTDSAPADFRVSRPVDGRPVYARVHTHPAAIGGGQRATKTTIRLLETRRFSLDSLGLAHDVLGRWRGALDEGFGMLLVSGPMGSGKSSTVFASVPEVVTEEVAAYSIEDPVEFELPGVTQYEISARNLAHRAELMTRTLHDIRRQDANVVIVGEIRDRQSMELAFDLATSGIRVLATVHAASALHTVQRLLQWELDPFVVATTLRGVLNMRLLQRLCADCRVPVTWADGPHLWPRSIFGRPLPEQGWAVNPRGCADCDGTGTRGQFPIAEFLSLAGTGVTALHHPEGVARLGGAMRLLEDEAVDALAGGTTSVAAVRRAQVGTTAELVTAEVPGNPLLGAEVTEEVYA